MVTPPGTGEKKISHIRQAAVYRKYLDLQPVAAKQPSGLLGGQFIVSAGFGLEGAELALASAIAGAAYLGIDPDPQQLKAAVRNGSCDFMVNTLDEALRVLKNELRKHKPVSVGLLGDASHLLPAMVERGVQPDLLSDTSPLSDAARYLVSGDASSVGTAMETHRKALRQFVERGAKIVNIGTGLRWALGNAFPSDADSSDSSIQSASIEVVWTTGNRQDLQRMDQIALQWLPEEDRVRRRWLEQAAGFFYRQIPRERVLQVSPDELPGLLDALQHTLSLQAPAAVRWRNSAGEQQSIALEAHSTDADGA